MSWHQVVALNSTTGALLWAVTPSTHPITSSPALAADGELLYVASQDGQLRAIRTADGSVQWSSPVGFVDGSSPAVSSPPVPASSSSGLATATAAATTVYIGSLDGHLHAVDGGSGMPRWKFKADGQVQSSPAIGSDGRLYFNSFKGTLYALDISKGAAPTAAVWEAAINSSSFSSPALGRKGLYLGSSDGVSAFLG